MGATTRRQPLATHRYRVRARWAGSTGAGYGAYGRAHRLALTADGPAQETSSDPAFLGDGRLPNPEVMLLGAASSCQLLSFLAVAARARLDVVAYEDDAEAVMPEDDPPTRITAIVLRPRITVRAPATEARVLPLVDVAHRECYVANSLNATMRIEATVTVVDP